MTLEVHVSPVCGLCYGSTNAVTKTKESLKENKMVLKFSVKAPGELNIFVLTEQLMKTGNLTKISISDD